MHKSLAVIAAAVLLSPITASAQGDLKWGPAPPVFPAGAKIAVLQGDPGATGLFTVRLEFPDGYVLPSHFHPTDEVVTVISGTFLYGMGDAGDRAKAAAATAGAFLLVPANMHHFAYAKGKTVVQVHAMGPFALTYVNPKEDPRGASAGK